MSPSPSSPDNMGNKSTQDKGEASGVETHVKWSQSPWIIGIGTAVIAGLLLAAILGILHYVNPGPGPAPDLELRNVSVASGSAFPFRPEEVDLTFLNVGTQTAVLTQADITVQEFTTLPAAVSAPNVEFVLPDHQYRVVMPPQPHQGQTVSVQLSESAAVDATDDFGLNFMLPARVKGHILVYRVGITVQYSKATLPVEVLISLPADPAQKDKCSSLSGSGFCALLGKSGYRSAALSKLQAQ